MAMGPISKWAKITIMPISKGSSSDFAEDVANIFGTNIFNSRNLKF